MFSPSAAEPGVQTRGRRRRQRPKATEETEPLPKAKRQRLPLNGQATAPTPTATSKPVAEQSEAVAPETAESQASSVLALDASPSVASEMLSGLAMDGHRRELSMRTKKPKTGERVSKGDGSVVLVTNNAYTVSKLPALPDRLRTEALDAQPLEPQCGSLFSSTGYGLSLTHTHAIVWPYTSPASSPETFTFTLPQSSRNSSDPLPLGSLVAPSASTPEPGLVVIVPTTGRVTFWESISSASTIDLMRQQRHGVEYTITGLSSGEYAIQLTNSDPSGFVVAFNSGRMGYVSVRDAHGRPGISFQFLGSSLTPSYNGLLGSIRNVLGKFTAKGDIAAIRSERTNRIGERGITAATVKGKLMAWRFHRGGQNELLNDVDLRDSLLQSVHTAIPETQNFPEESFEVFDFTYVPKGMDSKHMDMSRLSNALASDGLSEQHLLLLVGLTKRYTTRYCLVEVIVTHASYNIGMLRPISSYTTPSKSQTNQYRPRIYLPRPALVAFAIFGHSVVIASIANPPESPESQLQEEVTHALPDMFEDTIDLHEESNQDIIASGFEELPSQQQNMYEDVWTHRHVKPKSPAAVVVVRGVGILRISANDIDRFASERAPEVTAKSKLEQTVFFGSKAGTPLVFDGRREAHFSNEQLTAAAVKLSEEILSSTNLHIGTLPIGMAENLASRRDALDRLIKHLRNTNVQLSRTAKWQLLWNAEKMLVASLLWTRHEEYMAASDSASKEETFIRRLIFFIHENQKKDMNQAIGELDAVRHWFIYDVWRMDLFMAWIYESVKVISKHKLSNETEVTANITDALNLYVMSLSAAYKFREENLESYGLGDEKLYHGVLENYADLSEPWTGQKLVSTQLKKLLDMCYRWIKTYNHVPSKQNDGKQPSRESMAEIINGLPGLTDYSLLSTLEQARFSMESPVTSESTYGHQCLKQYENDKYDKVIPLTHLDLWEEAETLANKHNSWQAVAEILVMRIDALNQKIAQDKRLSPTDVLRIERLVESQKQRLESYFVKVGKEFAYAAYDVLLKHHGVSGVLDFSGDNKGYKTAYLRGKGELARISWIHDVQQEKDLSHAADTLLNLGSSREQKVWNKKIELSLGKLALMASDNSAKPKRQANGNGNVNELSLNESDEKRMADVDKQLLVIKVQDSLYAQVYTTAREAIDEAAEVELAMEVYAANIPKSQKVLEQVFESSMRQLLQHEALDPLSLIDLLTLGRYDSLDFAPFFHALEVAEASLSGEELKQTARLIWRRCLISDDWSVINATQSRDDSEVLHTLAQTQFLVTARKLLLRYQDAKAIFRPLKPSEVIGVYSEVPDRRFADMELAYQEKLLAAAAWEDSVLQEYISKHRLEHWAQTIMTNKQTLLSLDMDENVPMASFSRDTNDSSESESGAGAGEPKTPPREDAQTEAPARTTRSSKRLSAPKLDGLA
ncbi:hypothetical protein TD95_004686 [Thielaviopsis punctulata]|uniref:Nucleoporin Nup133/Nup155-like C-terminal domain-containing protein n=1 Tax=Thielaviopsis punctulata TaxID=72032 RepID=A0A0F4ZC12_9PEZI|nr:hypothetical protein TD95_004686 [Thielaviopsis punctulata]